MRFIMTARRAETGTSTLPPDGDPSFDQNLFSAYMRFNEKMYKAGILVASEGLNPSGRGARIEVRKGKRAVVDGPFAESKELVGGFYLLEVKSLEEAIEWALRCPTGLGFDDVLELRPLTEGSDLPPALLDLIRTAAPTWSATFHPRPA